MNKLERAYLAGFLKAADMMPQPPTGSPSMPQQLGSNSGGQQSMPSGQPMQMPQQGGISPMQQPSPGSGGLQSFLQMIQQLKQQNPNNKPAPPAVQMIHPH